mmetsp:Transcript_40996/g.130273  ORF Transcript_40996/g.130273 Transcript_40996/m.130273 type:complete len:390 (+) Transcript_40996:94-1263(+)
MLDFGFEPGDDRAKAGNILFHLRGCVLCIACAGLIEMTVLSIMYSGDNPDWTHDKSWYDVPGTEEYAFVCETAGSQCSDPWSSYAEGCYLNSQNVSRPPRPRVWMQKARWLDAQWYCSSMGGHLAVIHSEAENDRVHKVCASSQPCWIGLREPLGSEVFQWVDGTRLDFSKWADGEPNNYGDSDEDCAALGLAALRSASLRDGLFVGWCSAIANLLIMSFGMLALHQALKSGSRTSMAVSASSDSCCSCCLCVGGFLSLAGALMERGSLSIYRCVSSFLQLSVLLCIIAVSVNLMSKLEGRTARLAEPAVVQVGSFQYQHGMIVGAPVVGQVIQPGPSVTQTAQLSNGMEQMVQPGQVVYAEPTSGVWGQQRPASVQGNAAKPSPAFLS